MPARRGRNNEEVKDDSTHSRPDKRAALIINDDKKALDVAEDEDRDDPLLARRHVPWRVLQSYAQQQAQK